MHLSDAGHQVYALLSENKKDIFHGTRIAPILARLSPDKKQSIGDLISVSPDIVIHCAGVIASFRNEDYYETNYIATEKFIKHLATVNANIKFIMLSTAAVYGPSANRDDFMDETRPPCPVSHYGKSKLLGESSLIENAPSKWNIIILRLPVVSGYGDKMMSKIFIPAKFSLLPVPGLSWKKKQFSYLAVEDLCRSIEFFITFNCKLEIFNVAHRTPGAIIEFVRAAEKAQKKRIFPLPVPASLPIVPYAVKMAGSIFKIGFLRELVFSPDKLKEIKYDNWLISPHKFENLSRIVLKTGMDEMIGELHRYFTASASR